MFPAVIRNEAPAPSQPLGCQALIAEVERAPGVSYVRSHCAGVPRRACKPGLPDTAGGRPHLPPTGPVRLTDPYGFLRLKAPSRKKHRRPECLRQH
jgi:hypothetical protein